MATSRRRKNEASSESGQQRHLPGRSLPQDDPVGAPALESRQAHHRTEERTLVSRPQDIGAEFEVEFSERHGLRKVPGSGSQWHSKLDAHGLGVRWSLKATKHGSYTIDSKDLWELVQSHAPGEDGAMRTEP